MSKLFLLSSFLFLSFSIKISAQQRSCATHEAVKQQMAADPDYARKIKENEKNFKNYIQSRSYSDARHIKISIPVVVHVLYNIPEQNIPDAQVQSQIDVLNEDFTATNKDYNNYDAGYTAVKGDVDIKFCLVQVIHKATNKKSFGTNDQVKKDASGGSDPIDPMHFLNIWVCNLGQSLLGYAYYPGVKAEKFGAVIHYLSFGRGAGYDLYPAYNLGRTLTHEIGHCLGLAHIWGDKNCGDDQVDDTPLHNEPNFGCPEQGLRSTCTGTPLQMWMNYMDYTDDRCMYLFTNGQSARADFFMSSDPQLNSIINSTCDKRPGNVNKDLITSSNSNSSISRMNNPEFSLYPTITSAIITLDFNKTVEKKSFVNIYDQTGRLMMKQEVLVSKSNTKAIDVSRLGNGIYFLQLNNGTDKTTRKFIVQH